MGAATLKTNEGRPGTRAVARHVRVSASKAREVLNLVRGESYGRASEIVAFSERSVAKAVGKCLDSAVANAEHNDQVPAEELFVSACYADEGPTLKRWRPRARGRATPIHKRTCHITVVVSRYNDEELEAMAAQDALRDRAGASTRAAASRRERVERSRAVEAASEDEHEHDAVDEVVEDAVDEVVEDAVDEVVEDAVDEVVEDAVDEVVEDAVDEVVEDAVDEVVEDAVDEVVEDAVDEVVEDAVDEVVEDAVDEVVEDAVDEVVEDAVDEVVEDAVDEERA